MTRPQIALGISGASRPTAEATDSQRAEAAGFHSVWTGDTYFDAFTVLATQAVNTSRIGLGTGVAVWHRRPVGLVNAVAALDEISGGRVLLGLGAGPKQRNEDWHEISFERPVARMSEYIRLFHELWRSTPDTPVTFEGDFYRVRNFSRLHRSPSAHIPVYIGTVGPQMNRLAGAIADGVLYDVAMPKRYLAEVAAPAVRAGAAKHGRNLTGFTFAGVVNTSVDPDRTLAYQRAKRTLIWYSQFPYFLDAWEVAGFRAMGERCRDAFKAGDTETCYRIIPDEMVDATGIAGTPEECRTKLAEWGDLLDVAELGAPSHLTPADESLYCRQMIFEAFG